MEVIEAIGLYRTEGITGLIIGVAFFVAYQSYNFGVWMRKREIAMNDTLQAEVRSLHKEFSDFKSEMISKGFVREAELVAVLRQNHEATAKNLAIAKQIWEEASRTLRMRGVGPT